MQDKISSSLSGKCCNSRRASGKGFFILISKVLLFSIKNLNSFRALQRALEYEIGRHIQAVEEGEKLIQETRTWDDGKEITLSMRSKEEAGDYRYFPDPDLPPIILSEA